MADEAGRLIYPTIPEYSPFMSEEGMAFIRQRQLVQLGDLLETIDANLIELLRQSGTNSMDPGEIVAAVLHADVGQLFVQIPYAVEQGRVLRPGVVELLVQNQQHLAVRVVGVFLLDHLTLPALPIELLSLFSNQPFKAPDLLLQRVDFVRIRF